MAFNTFIYLDETHHFRDRRFYKVPTKKDDTTKKDEEIEEKEETEEQEEEKPQTHVEIELWNGDELFSSVSFENNESGVPFLETPVKEGYDFAGWYLDDTEIVEGYNKLNAGTYQVYAKWVASEPTDYRIVLTCESVKAGNSGYDWHEFSVKAGSSAWSGVIGYYASIESGTSKSTSDTISTTQKLIQNFKVLAKDPSNSKVTMYYYLAPGNGLYVSEKFELTGVGQKIYFLNDKTIKIV